MNAEISAFSSGDLNKYEFLTRKDLKDKPNALDKARFEFSPLGKTFSTGLDINSRKERIADFHEKKGKRYVDLPIPLSKLNINSSKELISNIEQLINNLYINKQITKQVYNILNKAITYKNDL